MNHNIGIAGLGTVASGLLQLLAKQSAIKLIQISSRTQKPALIPEKVEFNSDLSSLCNHPDIETVVELIGGTTQAYQFIKTALNNQKNVVTANKALLAVKGTELKALAQQNNVQLLYEASVCGGIPIIKTLKEYHLNFGVKSLCGIVNGSCNYILTQMQQTKMSFEEALLKAQQLGFAEADPSMDVDGIDSAQKIAILASICFNQPAESIQIQPEGITTIKPADLDFAHNLQYAIKHIASASIANGVVEAKVSPYLIDNNSIFSVVNGAMNGVLVVDQFDNQYFYYGPGAGAVPTATAVFNDIQSIHSQAIEQTTIANNTTQSVTLKQSNANKYYLRIATLNNPGIISKASQLFASYDINIETLYQPEQSMTDQTNNTIDVAFILNIKNNRMSKVVAKLKDNITIHNLSHFPVLS